jgi:hypothetical protein
MPASMDTGPSTSLRMAQRQREHTEGSDDEAFQGPYAPATSATTEGGRHVCETGEGYKMLAAVISEVTRGLAETRMELRGHREVFEGELRVQRDALNLVTSVLRAMQASWNQAILRMSPESLGVSTCSRSQSSPGATMAELTAVTEPTVVVTGDDRARAWGLSASPAEKAVFNRQEGRDAREHVRGSSQRPSQRLANLSEGRSKGPPDLESANSSSLKRGTYFPQYYLQADSYISAFFNGGVTESEGHHLARASLAANSHAPAQSSPAYSDKEDEFESCSSFPASKPDHGKSGHSQPQSGLSDAQARQIGDRVRGRGSPSGWSRPEQNDLVLFNVGMGNRRGQS